ncbi:MAG: amidohydrolase, partial [Sphingomonadales bacterium]|nr:amidohydrolase [Sphingomonadales bacterium]
MRRSGWSAVFAVSVLAVLSPCAASGEPVVAFRHVNVVPMDREQVLRDQDVVVTGNVITAIGPNLPIPAGARVIDAPGKYLSPGLADMHSHSESREDMKVYLANGVTTILNLGGASDAFVDQRVPLLNSGKRPGPHVY